MIKNRFSHFGALAKKYETSIAGIICLVLAGGFVTAFSVSTSPFYQTLGGDSAIFKLIGVAMTHGYVPYVDIFDHKGIVLFFIEYIGQLIAPGRFGIYLLQIAFLAGTLFYVWRIARLRLNAAISWIPVITWVVLLRYSYEGGNLSEEFSNLFNVIALYYLIKLIITRRLYDGVLPYAISGASLAMIGFIRPNNAAPILAAMTIALLYIAVTEKVAVTLKLAGLVLSGVAAVVIAVVTYAIVTHSLSEMIYASFTYNMKYSSFDKSQIPTLIDSGYIGWAAACIGISVLAALLYFIRKKDPWLPAATIAIATLSSMVVFVSTTGYFHYLQILLPSFAVSAVVLLTSITSRYIRWTAAAVILAAGMNLAIFGVQQVRQYDPSADIQRISSYQKVIGKIPKSERSALLTYNVASGFLLTADILPPQRYYTLQDWWGAHDPAITNFVSQYFRESSPKWVLIDGDGVANPYIQQELNAAYSKTLTEGSLNLYRRND